MQMEKGMAFVMGMTFAGLVMVHAATVMSDDPPQKKFHITFTQVALVVDGETDYDPTPYYLEPDSAVPGSNVVFALKEPGKYDLVSLIVLDEKTREPVEFPSCKYDESECVFRMPERDVELIVNFSRLYSVSVVPNDKKMGSTFIFEKKTAFHYNEEATLHASANYNNDRPTSENFMFDEWNDGEQASKRVVKVVSDTTFVANFKPAERNYAVLAKNIGDDASGDAENILFETPKFSVVSASGDIRIAGAEIGASYGVMDLQGRLLLSGRVSSANFELTVPHAGTYMVRIGNQSRNVTIR